MSTQRGYGLQPTYSAFGAYSVDDALEALTDAARLPSAGTDMRVLDLLQDMLAWQPWKRSELARALNETQREVARRIIRMRAADAALEKLRGLFAPAAVETTGK